MDQENPERSNSKNKRIVGRKPGYRMESWQKEVQTASLRSKEMEAFNLFFDRFVELSCEHLVGERFRVSFQSTAGPCPWDDPGEECVLETFLRRPQAPLSETLFNYVGVQSRWRRYCLKAYDHYIAVRDGKIRPMDPNVAGPFGKALRDEILLKGLKFSDAAEWLLPEP
ncbi:MAG: hypothetical protein ACC613_04240 [Synergistales bacterium]